MGSDFSNGDVGSQDIDDFNYKWLAVEKVSYKSKGVPCEKIEAEFKDKQKQEDYGYSKSTLWVHPKSGLTFKMDLFNMNGQLYKQARLISFLIANNEDGKRVYIPTSIEMENVIKGTKTVMKLADIKTGNKASKIKPSIYKTDYLTRKWW